VSFHNDNPSDATCMLKPPPTPRPAIGRQASVARTAVGHWLVITTVGLLLNAPDTTIRFLTLVGLLCEDCAIPWSTMESRLILSSKFIGSIDSDVCLQIEGKFSEENSLLSIGSPVGRLGETHPDLH
jgi:hypothetical protein